MHVHEATSRLTSSYAGTSALELQYYLWEPLGPRPRTFLRTIVTYHSVRFSPPAPRPGIGAPNNQSSDSSYPVVQTIATHACSFPAYCPRAIGVKLLTTTFCQLTSTSNGPLTTSPLQGGTTHPAIAPQGTQQRPHVLRPLVSENLNDDYDPPNLQNGDWTQTLCECKFRVHYLPRCSRTDAECRVSCL